MKSPVRYLSDEQYTALPVRERYLHVANSYVGEKETGTNWGPFVKATLKLSGIGVPAPWCAAFVKRCLVEAGWTLNGPTYSASTYWWWHWAKSQKRLLVPKKSEYHLIKRGMLFVWNGASGGHIGIVVSVDPEAGTISTIEGNTNSAGSREGDRVARKTRPISLLKSYPRWGFIDIEV